MREPRVAGGEYVLSSTKAKGSRHGRKRIKENRRTDGWIDNASYTAAEKSVPATALRTRTGAGPPVPIAFPHAVPTRLVVIEPFPI